MNSIEVLKRSGLKATHPRLKVLQVFQQSTQHHMSADEVFHVLLRERSDIGLATVYRVLTQFEQAGILNRRYFRTGKSIYALNNGQRHDHLICTRCGKLEVFYDPEVEQCRSIKIQASGWEIQNHALVLYGQCPDCTKKSAAL